MTPAFATECPELMRHPVVAWIAGHTHTAMTCSIPYDEMYNDKVDGSVQCVVNPRGYPNSREIATSGYNPEKTLTLTVPSRVMDAGRST